MEETGRELVWPAAIERIFSSPFIALFGVGEADLGMYVTSSPKAITPHNAFLRFWLSSGVVPFAFFLAFWIQAAQRSAMKGNRHEWDAYRLPLLLFTFVDLMFGDTSFMSLWALLAISMAAGSAVVYGKQAFVRVRIGNETKIGTISRQKPSDPRALAPYRS
jgi:O-antigen ligase